MDGFFGCCLPRCAGRPRCCFARAGGGGRGCYGQSDGAIDACLGLGYLLKKSEPQRALALFDEAPRLAGIVQNFWCYAIALQEAAATRAVHGDPVTAAQLFIEVLNHVDRLGDWTRQWLALR